MKPSVFRLIEAVRNLNLKVVENDGKDSLLIETNKVDFPNKLIILQKALEEFDKDESISKEVEGSTIDMYKSTLEALIEMIKSNTQDNRPVHAILEDAIKNYSKDDKKRDQGKAKSFSFKPKQKKKGDGEVKLDPLSQVPGTVSMEKHAQIGYRSEMALKGMGSAVEDLEKYKERAKNKAEEAIKKKQDSEIEEENNFENGNDVSPNL
jgi:hypothetical protein